MTEPNNPINRSLLLRLAVKLKRRTKSQIRNTGTTKRQSTRTTNLHECLLIEDYAKKSGTQLVTTPYQQWCKSENAPLETIGIVNLREKAPETSNTRWRNPWTSCSQCWTCSTAGKTNREQMILFVGLSETSATSKTAQIPTERSEDCINNHTASTQLEFGNEGIEELQSWTSYEKMKNGNMKDNEILG